MCAIRRLSGSTGAGPGSSAEALDSPTLRQRPPSAEPRTAQVSPPRPKGPVCGRTGRADRGWCPRARVDRSGGRLGERPAGDERGLPRRRGRMSLERIDRSVRSRRVREIMAGPHSVAAPQGARAAPHAADLADCSATTDMTGRSSAHTRSPITPGSAERRPGSDAWCTSTRPARYVWTREFDARGDNPFARVASQALRPLDRRRAQEGAEFAANSEFVRERIRNAWGVDARVIYPPVQVERIQSVPDWRDRLDGVDAAILEELPEGFLLGASRFIPYKRLERGHRGRRGDRSPVVLAGQGPEPVGARRGGGAARRCPCIS